MRTNVMLALEVANNAASVAPATPATCHSQLVVVKLEASGAGSAWGRDVTFGRLPFGVTNLREQISGPRHLGGASAARVTSQWPDMPDNGDPRRAIPHHERVGQGN